MNLSKVGTTISTPQSKERLPHKFTNDSGVPPQFIRSFDREVHNQKRLINQQNLTMDIMESGKGGLADQAAQLNKSYDFRSNMGGIKQKNMKIDLADMEDPNEDQAKSRIIYNSR